MKTYAVIENDTIIDAIIADSKEIAEQVSGKICIEYNEENPLGIGWKWSDQYNKYIPLSPFASWNYNGESWQPPINMPFEEGKYFEWDEESISWRSFDLNIS